MFTDRPRLVCYVLYASHDVKDKTLTMSTASIESLCAIAQTPTARTLKFPHAKETGSHAMHPLDGETQFTESSAFSWSHSVFEWTEVKGAGLNNRDREPEEERNSSGL